MWTAHAWMLALADDYLWWSHRRKQGYIFSCCLRIRAGVVTGFAGDFLLTGSERNSPSHLGVCVGVANAAKMPILHIGQYICVAFASAKPFEVESKPESRIEIFFFC